MSEIHVKSFKTDEVVEVIDTSQLTERGRDRVLMGLMRQMDLDNYYALEID
ncbi:hypothetical protein ACQ3HE_06845 [Plantibacter auratus]|uniref:hypothetical protein n=1 Tax=Plantibacter auratus TaxID=272914 RepID=UPI003D341629